MKTFEQYIERNKFKHGDYIIIKIKNKLYILYIHGTPGPKGHKINYYSLHILKKFNEYDNNIIDWVSDESIEINKEELETNFLYVTDTLEDAEKQMHIIKDSSKYNI